MIKKMMLEFYFQVLFCKFARIRKNNFSLPFLQMLRFTRRVKYYDTVYRRICYGFQTKTKEIYEVSFFETSNVLDETLSLKLAVGSELECNRTATLPESELTLIGV